MGLWLCFLIGRPAAPGMGCWFALPCPVSIATQSTASGKERGQFGLS